MSIPEIVSYPLPTMDTLPVNRVGWTLDAARAVLLIHDMQNYFLRFYGQNNAMLEQALTNMVAIRAWAKAHAVPVVYTAQPTHQSQQQRALLTDMWGPGLTTEDRQQSELVSCLQPDAEDLQLTKWRYSAFQRSNLQQQMQDWQRDQLIIVGVYAHIGCMTTALDAFMRDIQPFVVADAQADFSEAEHLMAMNYVAGRCGMVVTTNQLLSSEHEVFSRDWLLVQLLRFLDVEEADIDPDEYLIDYGLDSVQVMTLIAEWEKLGVRLMFEDLASNPTLNGWYQLLNEREIV